jgi:hypothetical protein
MFLVIVELHFRLNNPMACRIPTKHIIHTSPSASPSAQWTTVATDAESSTPATTLSTTPRCRRHRPSRRQRRAPLRHKLENLARAPTADIPTMVENWLRYSRQFPVVSTTTSAVRSTPSPVNGSALHRRHRGQPSLQRYRRIRNRYRRRRRRRLQQQYVHCTGILTAGRQSLVDRYIDIECRAIAPETHVSRQPQLSTATPTHSADH